MILSTLNEEGHAGNPKTDESDGNGVDSNSKEGDNPKKPNENQSTSKDEASDTKDDTKDITMEEGQQRMPVEKEEKPQAGGGDCEMTETDEKMEQKDQVPSDLQEKSVCGLCLGILQDSCEDVKQVRMNKFAIKPQNKWEPGANSPWFHSYGYQCYQVYSVHCSSTCSFFFVKKTPKRLLVYESLFRGLLAAHQIAEHLLRE